MLKSLKKAIAIMLTLVFVLSLLPLSALADATELTSVKITNSETETKKISGQLRGGSYTSEVQISSNPTSRVNTGNNRRIAFFHYDVSDYLPFLSDTDTSFVFSVQHGGSDVSQGRYAYMYDLYLVKGDHVDISSGTPTSKMTMDYARTKLGIVGATTSFTLNTTSDNLIKVKSYGDSSTKNMSLVSHDVDATDIMKAVGDSGWVTFLIESTAASDQTSYFLRDAEGTYLQIKYNPDFTFSDQDFLDGIVANVQWSDLSSDESTSVANQLVTNYLDTTIAWSSNPAGLVNADGTINPKSTEQTATLTATFTYVGENETVTASKSFDVTIAPEQMVTTDLIPFINYCYSRNNGASNGLTTTDYGYSSGSSSVPYFYSEDSTYVGYAQLDLSDYAEILNAPSTTATIHLTVGNGYGTSATTYGFSISTVTDNADLYINEVKKMSRVKARDLGIHPDLLGGPVAGRPVFYEWASETGVQNGALDPDEANIDALASAFNESATNGLVTFLFNSEQRAVMRFGSKVGIKLSYYRSELDSEEHFDSIESSFKWANITNDDANALVNDLPTYFKGATIEWTSDNGTVKSDGTLVPVAGEFTKDKITATVSYKGMSFTSEEFEVTVCDGNVTLGAPALTVDKVNGTATASISVTNGKGSDVSYQLYLAVYTDGELTALVPYTFDVSKGTADSKELYAQNIAAESKVKFLVWEEDNKTPATVFVEE